MARGNKQFQCPECSTRVSRQKDLQRHMMLHSKSEQHWYACPDCPVKLLQKSNLETHRAKHHAGNERYKCTDAPDCTWGGSNQGVLAKHRRKYHGTALPYGVITQPIPEGSAYERETTAESSASNDFDAPTNGGLNPGETFMDQFISGRSTTLNASTPARAPFGDQYAASVPVNLGPPRPYVPAVMYPGPSWNGSNAEISQHDMGYEAYGPGPPIPRTSISPSSLEYAPGPSSSGMFYVDEQGLLKRTVGRFSRP